MLALVGELGAGKTRFVKGLVAALGSRTDVTSPTFTLIHEYRDARVPVYHFDFFRLENLKSAERLGLDDYFYGEAISVVEWADKFPQLVPSTAIWIRFVTNGETQRTITIE